MFYQCCVLEAAVLDYFSSEFHMIYWCIGLFKNGRNKYTCMTQIYSKSQNPLTLFHVLLKIQQNLKHAILHISLNSAILLYLCLYRSGGTCSHMVGLVKTIQQLKLLGLKDAPAEQASTSLPQIWHIPRGNKINPVSVNEVVVTKAKEKRQKAPIIQKPLDYKRLVCVLVQLILHKDNIYFVSIGRCPLYRCILVC